MTDDIKAPPKKLVNRSQKIMSQEDSVVLFGKIGDHRERKC